MFLYPASECTLIYGGKRQLQGVLAAVDHHDGLPFYERIGRGRAQLALRDQCMVIVGSIELYLMSLQPNQPARPQVPLPFADNQYPFNMYMGIRSPDGLQSPLPTTVPLPTVVGNFWNLNNIANTMGSSFNSTSTQMHQESIAKKTRRRRRVYKSESDQAVNEV
ncbi:hypothetical protein BJ165DRAFT_348849 [Panaeolus papilionaceus]|nr:hypothetical protein BJ165DRAFT_348849 [Panaeolus papilionaceus]